MREPGWTIDPLQIRLTAEEYYRSELYYCSEEIVKTIKDAFGLDYPDRVVRMASGSAAAVVPAGQ